MSRSGKESLCTVLLGAVVTLLASGAVIGSLGVGGNVFMATFSFAVGGAGVAFLVWLLLVFAANFLLRARPRWSRIVGSVVAALIVAVGNTMVYTLGASGEWAALASAIVALASGVFAVSAIAATLLTYLVFLRPRPA